MNFYVYDLETFPNCFLFTGKFFRQPEFRTFEISSRRNDRDALLQWCSYLQNAAAYMVGFNSLSFDYPILHKLLTEPYTFTSHSAQAFATAIISSQRFGGGANPHTVRFRDRILPEIDLMKVNHFDNKAKATSLKTLQFAMRAESVEDLPFDPTKDLTSEQMDQLIAYNRHDVAETERFLEKCLPNIQMRKDLLDHGVISGDVLNYSDVKIGTEYLVAKIGRNKCFVKGSVPRQTQRTSVAFRDIILPKIEFSTPGFNSVLEWFKAQTIYMGSDVRPKLKADLGGIPWDFGMGGVHASVENKFFRTTDTHVIWDVDVSGMYPSIAVANSFAPEHLGQSFVTAFRQLQADRKQYPKGSMMNLVLKLANNGATGNFENSFSCLFDPKCAYSVRINGQLQLLQLAELLHLIPGVQMIQANTDGITALVPRSVDKFFQLWCNQWEAISGLKLEHAEFERMWIRDVNNYIAVYKNGSIKRKGAYWYPLTDEDYHGSSGSNWNKDFSNLTAQKGVEACLLHGHRPSDIIRCLTDPFDFMLRYKTTGGAQVFIGDKPQLKTVRYYVSTAGEPMKKVAPPKGPIGEFKKANGITDEVYRKVMNEIGPGKWDARIHTKNKSKYATVVTGIESGRRVKECNRASDFNWKDVDFDYYEKEIEKLLIGESNVTPF